MKNVKLNVKSIIKTKEMKHSFGCVNLYKDNKEFCSYKGCVYQNKNSFITLIQDFALEEDADRYEIEFKHLKVRLLATIFERDENTGVTVFKMESDLCETLSPLVGESLLEAIANDNVYLPLVQFGGEIKGFMPIKIVTVDGCYYVPGGFDVRELGLPLLNSAGNIIGVVTRESNLSEKHQEVLDLLINYGDDVIQPAYRYEKLTLLQHYMAIASPLVPLPEVIF